MTCFIPMDYVVSDWVAVLSVKAEVTWIRVYLRLIYVVCLAISLIDAVFFRSTEQTTLANEVANKNSLTWNVVLYTYGCNVNKCFNTRQNSHLIHSTVFFLLCHIRITIFHLAILAFILLGFVIIFFITYNVNFFQDTY